MIIYLYKKTHQITGLKYLGKTIKDPHKYKGSGLLWKEHLKEHGNLVDTEILKECNSVDDLKYWGKYYSELWNIVKSDEWANKIPETGGGPGRAGHHSGKNNPMYGRLRDDLKSDFSPNKKDYRRKQSSELAKNLWANTEYKTYMQECMRDLWKDPQYLHKMNKRKRSYKKVSIDGVIFQSLIEAAQKLKLDPSTISKRCSSSREKYKNWVYLT